MPPPPARARLADIAGQAGVSEATVSRVLNDRPGVRPDTRQAVLTALDVLGYERPEAMSDAAVRALIDEVNRQAAPHSEYIFRPELVVRGSTGVAPR